MKKASMEPFTIGAVSVSESKIKLCVNWDINDTIEFNAKINTLQCTHAYKEAIKYLEGVVYLMEYFIEEKLQDSPIEIQLDNLLAFNILTRYISRWKKQQWHTSRNEPIPVQPFMYKIDTLLTNFKDLKFKNLSNRPMKNIRMKVKI